MSARVIVPGRIELLGKHTDYAGGPALLVAVDRGFTLEAEPADGRAVMVRAEESGEEVRVVLVRGAAPAAARPAGAGPGWSRYVEAVVSGLLAALGDAPAGGARLSFRSSLPPAAGLGSSSALLTAVFLGLDEVWAVSERPDFRAAVPDREALAGWLASVERGGEVGTRGGSEDHTAILCARAGHVVRFGLAPFRGLDSAPVPEGWLFAVGVSGVVADKGGAVRQRFNRLSDMAADAGLAWAVGSGRVDADALPTGTGDGSVRVRGGGEAGARNAWSLGSALEAGEDAASVLEAIRHGAPRLGLDERPLLRRAGHFLEECGLVRAAFRALEARDLAAFADAVNHSAVVGAELLGNQVAETVALTALARRIGAPAASPFGAGFGGSVWALVREPDAGDFLIEWERAYREAFPERGSAAFFASPASAPARVTGAGGARGFHT